MHVVSTKRRGAITIWAALAVVVIAILVTVVGAVLFSYKQHEQRTRLENARLEAQAKEARAELERKTAADQAKIALAQTQRDQVLSPVRTATNLLGRLLTGISEIDAQAQALKTNDTGKLIARYPDLTTLARRVYETELRELPTRDDAALKLEGARRLEQQLVAAAGTSYTPEPEMEKKAQEMITWSTEGEVKLSRVRGALAALVSESKVKVGRGTPSAESPTLEMALNAVAVNETSARLKTLGASAAEAKSKADIETAKAEAARIQTEAETAAKAILAEANAKKEQAEREIKEKEAELKIAEAKTQVAVKKSEDEATKVLLRQKASDPKVLAELAPFTTPGYWKIRGFTTDKKPLSLTALQSAGALSDDIKGQRALIDIATSSYDKVRPRWHLNRNFFMTKPENLEKVKSAQSLLIELGPVLVEKGLLEP